MFTEQEFIRTGIFRTGIFKTGIFQDRFFQYRTFSREDFSGEDSGNGVAWGTVQGGCTQRTLREVAKIPVEVPIAGFYLHIDQYSNSPDVAL